MKNSRHRALLGLPVLMTAFAPAVGECSSPDEDATALTTAIGTATDLQTIVDGFVGGNLAPQIVREW